ncbi:YceI family protein [Draconibacterium sp. IB214405]|uniref:YceI family protein n=1 Tax=Draconibacterium sp. IB214405 TaxID=3097352 RepID=UPI002A100E98|nr:YceI family protein [Draconibacterium sp. IB214405]MDX8337622.1 YceI family protein [Draconibacterium sp. IB214405]
MKKTTLKYYFLLLFSCFLCLGTSASKFSKTRIPENCSNFVLIQGSSNVNRFEFIHEAPQLVSDENKKNRLIWKQKVIVPVDEFTGSNQLMRKDFLDLLNASEYPVIQIEIEPETNQGNSATADNQAVNATITLAGNTHEYLVPCEVSSCETSEIIIKGSLKVNLTDFNIKPPQKVLGAIKVNDEVFITFAFKHEFVR